MKRTLLEIAAACAMLLLVVWLVRVFVLPDPGEPVRIRIVGLKPDTMMRFEPRVRGAMVPYADSLSTWPDFRKPTFVATDSVEFDVIAWFDGVPTVCRPVHGGRAWQEVTLEDSGMISFPLNARWIPDDMCGVSF